MTAGHGFYKQSVYAPRRRGFSGLPARALPDWTVTDAKDAYSLGAAITLAGLENTWIRLTAATQRAVLGFPVFGKATILFDGEQWRVNRNVCGGGHVEFFTAAQVNRAAAGRKRVGQP
jgi:hypothetical protein